MDAVKGGATRGPKFEPTPPPRPVKPLTKKELEAIAPLDNEGRPDMFNYMPTRLIPLDEAQQRGWLHFYDGRACRFGHQAPRNVSNAYNCVDCARIKKGKTPIGGKASGIAVQQKFYEPRVKPDGPRPVEPDRFEKAFLVEYAAVKDLDRAAKLVGSTPSQVHMRLSTSKVFREACNDLEKRLDIKQTVPEKGEFEWNEDKRARLLEVFIDSGDIATARDAIGVTASEWNRELNRNSDFNDRYLIAYPLANKSLEERAKQLALAGNVDILKILLKAEQPDKFTDRVNVNMNVTEKLTDEQIDSQLKRYFAAAAAARQRIVATVDVEPPRQIESVGAIEGAGPTSESQSNRDLL